MPAQITAASTQTSDDLHTVVFDLIRGTEQHAIPTAVDHAYEMIWRQLIRGQHKQGERLTDTELATQLGLSRTPVRQAMHRLAQEDLLRLDARRGFSVREFTVQDVHEIYDVRGALEALALRRAAPHLSNDQIQAHMARQREVRDALKNTHNQRASVLHLEADLRFHNMLIYASGNDRLVRILAALRSQQALFQYWDTSYPQRNEEAVAEHERILLALAERATDDAATHLAQHIANAKNRVLADLFGVTDLGDQPGMYKETSRTLQSRVTAYSGAEQDDK